MTSPKRILLLLVLFTGLALGFSIQQSLESRTPPLSIRIAVSQTPLSTPFYVAQEQGYFADHGINVELLPYVGGHRCFNALIDGEADLATTSDSVIMFNSFGGTEFSILASFVESDNDIKIVSAPGQHIQTASELRGKRIGIIHNSASEFFLHTLLLINGVPAESITLVPLRPDAMVTALDSGEIDAAAMWEPFAQEAAQLSNHGEPILNSRGIYTLSFNLITMRELATPQLEAHRRVIAALNDATRFIAVNPASSQRIIATQLQRAPHKISHGWDDYLFKLSLSNSLISTLEHEARWALNHNRVAVQPVPNYRALVDARALIATDAMASQIQ